MAVFRTQATCAMHGKRRWLRMGPTKANMMRWELPPIKPIQPPSHAWDHYKGNGSYLLALLLYTQAWQLGIICSLEWF